MQHPPWFMQIYYSPSENRIQYFVLLYCKCFQLVFQGENFEIRAIILSELITVKILIVRPGTHQLKLVLPFYVYVYIITRMMHRIVIYSAA